VISPFKSKEFLLFIATGGTAAAVNFCSRIVLSQWLSFSLAIVLAYCAGAVTAYILTRRFVFKNSQQPISHSISFFVLINLVAVLQTWAVTVGLALYVFPAMHLDIFRKEIAHGIGVIVPVFSSYAGHKKWTFR
jgi:putative flippase GtrA